MIDKVKLDIDYLSAKRDLALKHAWDLETEIGILCGIPADEAKNDARQFLDESLGHVLGSYPVGDGLSRYRSAKKS